MRALASWAVTLTAPTKKTTRHLAPACCKECILRAHGCRMRRGCCHAHPPGQHQRLSHPQRPRNQGQSLASGNKEQVQPKSVVVHRFPQPVSSACMATTWELDIEYSWPPEGAWRDTLFKDWTSNWQLMARQEKAKKRNHCLWQPQVHQPVHFVLKPVMQPSGRKRRHIHVCLQSRLPKERFYQSRVQGLSCRAESKACSLISIDQELACAESCQMCQGSHIRCVPPVISS
eukprot:1148096-Pelagomonas_calceolata.AAC.2